MPQTAGLGQARAAGDLPFGLQPEEESWIRNMGPRATRSS